MGGYAIRVKGNDGDDVPTRCIRLGPADFLKLAKLQSLEFPAKAELMDRSKGDWISKSITSIQIVWFVFQSIGRAVQKLPVTTLELFTCAIVACTAITYVAWWNKPLDVQRPIVLNCEVTAAFLVEHKIQPLETYYSLLGNDTLPSDSSSNLQISSPVLVNILAFTAPHLIGWNFHFPTRMERQVWRVASMLCAGLPIMIIGLAWYETGHMLKRQKTPWSRLFMFFASAYILVRAYLLFEVFVGLRSVPADVYTAVNWSAYIPHI